MCDWIQLCYTFEFYREAASLAPYVFDDEVDEAIYRRAMRLSEASKAKLGW